MGVITHTPAEKALIEALCSAEGWRADVRQSLHVSGLPTKRAEAWKWSDLRRSTHEFGTLAKSHARSEKETPIGPHELTRILGATEVVIANGRLHWWPDESESPVGFEPYESNTANEPWPGVGNEIARIAAAIASQPEVTVIQLDADQHRPVLLNHQSDDDNGVEASRVGIVVKSGVKAVLIEAHEASGGFQNKLIEIVLEERASLEHVIVDVESSNSSSVRSTLVKLEKGAHYTQAAFTTGSKLSRHETHVTHAGEGAEAHIGGVYLLDKNRHADFTSTVTHTGPGGITRQLVKGAAAAHAQGVFQGKFKVEQAAQQTDAQMTHRALMLDERAEIDAKPELEIYADDVQCAHGNALGAIDETALFYMRQRVSRRSAPALS